MNTSQTQSYEGFDKKYGINVVFSSNRNDTGFAFEDSFIIIGENFVRSEIYFQMKRKSIFSFDDRNITFYSI